MSRRRRKSKHNCKVCKDTGWLVSFPCTECDIYPFHRSHQVYLDTFYIDGQRYPSELHSNLYTFFIRRGLAKTKGTS